MTQRYQYDPNTINQDRIRPADVEIQHFTNPTKSIDNLKLFVGTPDQLLLPNRKQGLKQEHYVPYPLPMRYLTMNSAISRVTQLDRDAIGSFDQNNNPLLRFEIPQCEYLNILLLHPRDEEYNEWQWKYIDTPEICATHMSVALRQFQINYTIFATNKKSSPLAIGALRELRARFKLLPRKTQDLIFQILAPKPGRVQTLISPENVRWGDDHGADKVYLKDPKILNAIQDNVLYWDTNTAAQYKDIAFFPHEGSKHYKLLTSQERKQLRQKRKQLEKQDAAATTTTQTTSQTSTQTSTQQTVDDVTQATPAQLVNNNNLGDLMTPSSQQATNKDKNKNKNKNKDKETDTTQDEEDTQTTIEIDVEEDGDDETKIDDTIDSQPLAQSLRNPALPPKAIERFKPPETIYYWNIIDEGHRYCHWLLERAWYELLAAHTLDKSKWKDVNNKTHAGTYATFTQIKKALTLNPQQRRNIGWSRDYAPGRARGIQWHHQHRQPHSVNPNQQQQQQGQPQPPPGNQNPNPNPNPPQPQAQSHYARLGQQSQINQQQQATTQTFYNNPQDGQQLAHNIHAAYASGQLPPRVHDHMVRDPTGTVNLPAPATTTVENRYPTSSAITPIHNFTDANLDDVDAILGEYNYGVPQRARNQAQTTSHINTSCVIYI